MKTTRIFLAVAMVLCIALATGTAWGQGLLLEENFAYTAGTLLTATGNWTAHSGAGGNPITVTSPGLTYTGYPSSGIGNAVSMTTSGEDDNRTFTSQTSGNVYAAFLANLSAAILDTGTYFFHLAETPIGGNIFRAKVFAKRDASNNLAMGVTKAANGGIAWTGFTYALNTTYLIVVKYAFNSGGTTDDVVTMWINPPIGTAEPSPDLTALDNATQTDALNISTVALRQATTSLSPTQQVDGIRIGTTWESILPPAGTNQLPIISNITRSAFVPEVAGTDTVRADISDPDGTIAAARLHMIVNGGAADSIDMSIPTEALYQAIIPATKHVFAGDLVEYFISAVDNLGGYTSTEGSKQGYLVGDATIATVKSHALSVIANHGVRVNGTINVRTNTHSNGQGYIQDATGGLQIYKSGGLYDFNVGRNVKVQGTIINYLGAYELTTPNFAFVDTVLGTSTVTPVTITLPITQAPDYVYEGKLVKIFGLSTDSAGTFSASKGYIYREADLDTITVRVENYATTNYNTLVGLTIPGTSVDAIGILSFWNGFHRLKPRTAEDFGMVAGDGTGTATIRPASRLQNVTAVAETVTVTGNGINTLEGVNVTIPSSWTWDGTSYTIVGTGTPAVTGNGTSGNPWVITVTGASVTNTSPLEIQVQNMNTPSATGPTTFTVQTRRSGGIFANIATSPVVTISALTFDAVQTGYWSAPSTWSAGVVPGAADSVTFKTLNVVVTIDVAIAQCGNLTMIGTGSVANSGPVLQFENTGVRQLTINGNLSISGGSGSGFRGGRPTLDSKGNPDATLVVKKNIMTSSSNSASNGHPGLNMNVGTVRWLGVSSDTLKSAAGLRLGNLIVGDGNPGKTFVATITNTTLNRVALQSLLVRSGSTLRIGEPSSRYTLTFGSGSAGDTGVALLTGGVSIQTGASIVVDNPPDSAFAGNFYIAAGGLTNSGTLVLKSPNSRRRVGVSFGGFPRDTINVNHQWASSTGTFASVTAGSGDSLSLSNPMNGDTLIVGGLLRENAGNTFIGRAIATRTLTTATNETFGGIGAEINAAGAAPGSTTVQRVTGIAHGVPPNTSILRYFDIAPATNTGLNATFRFYYDNSELGGNTAVTLLLAKSITSGVTWTLEGGTVNTGSRYIDLAGVNSFSRWTASSSDRPLHTITVTIPVRAGWNLVSNPIYTSQDSVLQLFPPALLPYAFSYVPGTGYVQSYRMERGKGYWLKFGADANIQISGNPVARDSMAVTAGWNMIGSISYRIDTTTIFTIPAGIKASHYYGFWTGGYYADSVIAPGKGYWIKASGIGGKFVVGAPGAYPKQSAGSAVPLELLNSITLTDNVGNTQTLYFGSDGDGALSSEAFEMPPPGPEGVFDARFESQKMVETFASGMTQKAEYPMRWQSAVYPVVVSWNVNAEANRVFFLQDALDGSVFQPRKISGTGSVVISNPAVDRLILSTQLGEIPAQYVLEQNYPNPFNPSTLIRFGLPANSHVSLRVYNVLGQQVAELVNGALAAGYHAYTWSGIGNSGSAASSGVYFYKIDAAPENGGSGFNQVRKMLLLK